MPDANKLSPEQQETHQKLMTDFPFYAANVLKVSPAAGGIAVPFILNPAQRYLHAVLEKQKKEKGWVRAVILKARRLGFSTYIGGRYYHITSTMPGKKAFILTHHSKTTQTLFNMTKQFHKDAPGPVRPDLGISNVYQIIFDKLNSEYAVGTAGSAEIGRGLTIQLFHASEAAFWENTNKITAGVLQAIQILPGTELIFESTANGKGNMFHRMCMDALHSVGDFILIFAPWYWHPDYSRTVPDDFQLTKEELELKSMPIMIPSVTGLPLIQTNLTNEQIYWRRMKIIEFRNEADPIGKFKQEYPATVAEAFQKFGSTLITPAKVVIARKNNLEDPSAAMIMGCDLARKGTEIVFAYRKGRKFVDYEKIPPVSISDNPTNILTSIIAQRLERRGVDQCFIDYGHGHGVFDNLCSIGYTKIVKLVHFNEKPLYPDKYLNKRTEIYMLLRDWLHEGGVDIPDLEELEINLLSIPDYKVNARELQYLVSKESIEADIKIDLGISDAIALTFAYPVKRDLGELNKSRRVRKSPQQTSNLKSRNRLQRRKKQLQAGFNWGGGY